MNKPITLPVFSSDEYQRMHHLLATKVAQMMGRKFEENDWSELYCLAKNIPYSGWSNLDIDIIHQGLGLEHKQLRVSADKSIITHCGERKMHPSLTRSIRIPSLTTDANQAMHDILNQYAQLITMRSEKVRQTSSAQTVDMRVGWLLWQDSLEEFLYFEQPMTLPNPSDYYAEWRESKSQSARKQSVNLWIYEKQTGIKRYSVTTTAGAKIQGYFDIPAPDDPHLYVFRVQGEVLNPQQTRIWITQSTQRELQSLFDVLKIDDINSLLLGLIQRNIVPQQSRYDLAQPLILTPQAYITLKNMFDGVSDEHRIRLLIDYLRENFL